MAVGSKNARQFTDLFGEVIPFKATVDFASSAAGTGSAIDVTVPGAALGDFVLVAPSIDVADTQLSGEVTAADVVTVMIQANTLSGTEDLASQTISGVVLKRGGAFAAL
jgi:hypothetical protein